MGYAQMKSLEGFITAGNEVPFANPHKVVIVGRDVPESADNWYAHCPRLEDETPEALESFVQDILEGAKTDPVDVVRDGNRAIVLDGRRTTLASRIAYDRQVEKGVPEERRASIRLLFVKGTEDDFFRINKDSHKAKPLTIDQDAKQVLDYYNHVGHDTKKVAAMFAITEANVKQKLSFFSLDKSIQKAVKEGFPFALAIKLVDLPRDEQKKAFAEMQEAGATRGAAAANAITKIKRGEKVEKADKSRMRPRALVEKWAKLLHKDPRFDGTADVIDYIFGKEAPPDMLQMLGDTMTKVGLIKEPKPPKEPKVKKEKKVKEPKPPKAPKEPKAKKGKKAK